MTGNHDFDQTLQAWMQHQAPRQAPDHVLDSALERVAAQRQTRPWPQRLLGRRTIAVAFRAAAFAAAVAIAVVIGLQFADLTIDVGPSPSPAPSAVPSPSPSAAPTQAAVESLGPTTKPGPAALVAVLSTGGEIGPFHLMTVFDDGRLITSDPTGAEAPVERRLTAAGIQLVRDEIAATGLTDTTADFSPVPNPGVEPPGFIGTLGRLEIGRPGGGTVVITWNLYGDDDPGFFQPQPEAEALQALSDRLSTLEEWLPAVAWVDASGAPYVPDTYRMRISGSPWGGTIDSLPADVATVSWPVGIDLPGLAEAIESSADETRCSVIEEAAGTAVIEAVQAAGAAPVPGEPLSFWLGVPATSRLVEIRLAPIVPFDVATC